MTDGAPFDAIFTFPANVRFAGQDGLIRDAVRKELNRLGIATTEMGVETLAMLAGSEPSPPAQVPDQPDAVAPHAPRDRQHVLTCTLCYAIHHIVRADAEAAHLQQLQLVTNATIGWHEANARAEAAEASLESLRAALAPLTSWTVWTKGQPGAMRSGLFHASDGDAPNEDEWGAISRAFEAVYAALHPNPAVMADGEAEGDSVTKYRETLNAILVATPGTGESKAVAPELFAQRNTVRALAIEALGELSDDERVRWFTNRHTVIEAEPEGEVKYAP